MTEDKYYEIRNVRSEMTQATEFLVQADKAEEAVVTGKALKEDGLKHTMTSTYLITFDEYWY